MDEEKQKFKIDSENAEELILECCMLNKIEPNVMHFVVMKLAVAINLDRIDCDQAFESMLVLMRGIWKTMRSNERRESQ